MGIKKGALKNAPFYYQVIELITCCLQSTCI